MTTTFDPEFDFTYRIDAARNITEARDEYSPEVYRTIPATTCA